MAELPDDDDVQIPWKNVVRFIRQLSHDVRNNLNATELQAAYLEEIAENAETKAEIKRLRELMAEVSKSLQRVTSKMVPVTANRIPYRCADFIEDLKSKLASTAAAARTNWEVQLENEMFEIDPMLLQEAVLELFENATRHSPGEGPLVAIAAIKNTQFELTLREPKEKFDASTRNWAREPLGTIGRSQYGLGLNRVRLIVEGHGGGFGAEYDPKSSALVSRIVLPLSKPTSR